MKQAKHRVLLVGLGRMGRNHFRILRQHPAFVLVGVLDRNPSATAQVQADGVAVFQDLDEVDWARVDAAVIATPTDTHTVVVESILARGKHLLVEKPLASTTAACRALCEQATRAGVRLGIGHIERFNPVVVKLREVIQKQWVGRPIHFSITRVGGYPSTAVDGNNVILDLAVHDLDLIRKILGRVRLVSAICHSTLKEGVIDTAEIMVMAECGVSATLSVNWITPTKIRAIRVTGTRAVCMVDYVLQTCQLFGGSLLDSGQPPECFDFTRIVEMYQNSDRIELGVVKDEPLRVEYDHFGRMLSGEPNDLCDGHDATQVVGLAEEAIRLGVRTSVVASTERTQWY